MTGPARPSLSKPLRSLLIVSLAANLLVGGLLAGSAFRVWGGGRPSGEARLQLGPFLGALPREDRQQIGERIRDQMPPDRAQRAAVLAQAVGLLEAEVFDAVAFSALLGGLQERSRGAQDVAFESLIMLISEMTPEERLAYAEALRAARNGN